MTAPWGRRPYLTADCATCRHWLDVPAGGRCRLDGVPEVECGDDGRTCLTFREAQGPDWPAMVARNEGVRGL